MSKVMNHACSSRGDYNQPIEIHSSSSKSCSPITRDFELLDNLYSDPTFSGAMDLNSDYVRPTHSIGILTSVKKNHPEFCQEQVYNTAITIFDKSKSVSMSKSTFENLPTSLPSISDPMSIDNPLGNPLINLSSSIFNEDLVTSVSKIDLNVKYDSPIRSCLRPSFDLIINFLDLTEQRIANTNIETKDCNKCFSAEESVNSIKSTNISIQTFITPTENKICLAGSASIANPANSSGIHNNNTTLLSYPTAIQNSPEFWDSTIRTTEEVEARIRNTKKHTYEDLSTVARYIDFFPRIFSPKPLALIKSSYEAHKYICFVLPYKLNSNI
ncbi:hypothetical protein ZOSMA_103G00120 [Zostera marina]|uniref:Uncharacterized protein n=1 Tax=Zostera marina TaxID=29655 RepID=A0A0K9Q679_ZOSMR|nr:hypothetical protein ZOSMA_103G00120 [Zostera marina]